MNKILQSIKQPIVWIMGLALGLKLILYTSYPPFWDAASYILMGKYIFSSGAVGLIEPFRPPLWPLILGFFWKVGIDPIVAGKILEIILGMTNILLVYLIGKKVFSENTGLWAALLVTLSPTFFLWGNSLYTDIPGSALGLLMVYLFLNENFFWAGIVGGLTFFTRFAQVFALLALAATLKKSGKSLLGFTVVVLLFLGFNQILYHNYWLPFEDAKNVYVQPLELWQSSMAQCLKLLVTEENPLLPLIILSLLHLFKTPRRAPVAIGLAGLWSLAVVGKITTNDYHRLSLTALPYLYLLLAHSLTLIQEYLKKIHNRLGQIFMLAVAAFFVFQLNTIIHMRFPQNERTVFQEYVAAHHKDIQKGNLWVSSPKMLVFSNLKAQEQMYHPIFSYSKAQELRKELYKADTILFNSHDIPCVPAGDERCQKEKTLLIEEIKQNFRKEFYAEDPKGQYVLGIFTSAAQNQ